MEHARQCGKQESAGWIGSMRSLKSRKQSASAETAIHLNSRPPRHICKRNFLMDLLVPKSTWSCDPSDILLPEWAGKTVKDLEALNASQPDEWLLIQAWDES